MLHGRTARGWLACALLAAGAKPAAAQHMLALPRVSAPLPALSLPASPVSWAAAMSAPLLALPAPLLSPILGPSAAPVLTQALAPVAPAAPSAEPLVRKAGASESFTAQVQAQLRAAVPAGAIADILAHGYIILVKDHLTQDRPDLSADLDYTGGLNDWGPLGNFIMVAERIRSVKTLDWMESQVWRNAVVHECGHAVDHVLKATDSSEIREAWAHDLAAMPEAAKAESSPDGRKNPFYYFVRPGPDGSFDRARQETWAEGFDILMRGEASSFNYANFQAHFPRTLAAMRGLLEARYGRLGA